MLSALQQRIKQDRGLPPGVEAMLNLLVASDHVRQRIAEACAAANITQGQYNVLRILRGAHPTGHSRCEIARRMLERSPDVTRLIDRLEAQGLAVRDRSQADRRLSITRITDAGLRVLDQLEPAIQQVQRAFDDRVGPDDRRELTRICEQIYREG